MTHELLAAEELKAKADQLLHPQKERADKALAAISKRISQIQSECPEELVPVSSDRILRGDEPFDAKTFTAALARIRERQPFQEEIERLGQLALDLRAERRERRGSGPISAVYDFLNEQLAALVQEVRQLGHVPATAEEAVSDRASADAYARGQRLVAVYEAIRTTQIDAWRSEGEWSAGHMPVFRETLTADAIERDRVWLHRWQSVRTARVSRRQAVSDFILKLPEVKFDSINQGPGPFPKGVNRVAYLRWLANECQPWVIGPEQARRTHREWKDALTSAAPPERRDAESLMYSGRRSVGRTLGI
ncbi:hypothetical protein [Brevibacterium yomogidense]|uniref:hypothetical protein n=1 Tax=Brevibacterium yomogidense TaxID=946573 RepID=UPI0018DFE02C|nr:hypothetical protein [Brevibacterium yomogidense]